MKEKNQSIYKLFLAFVFAVFLISLPLIVWYKNKEPEKLPVLGTIPNFQLLNQESSVVQGDSFTGRVLIVNFIFTSCPDTCPLLTAQMKKIQEKLKERGLSNVSLLSITVDPSNDTPSVLKAYAQKYSADLSSWSFLTGKTQDIQNVVVGGFKISMQNYGVSENSAHDFNIMDITHGEQFVLVDELGQIRAYRTARSASDLDKILSVVEKLI